MKKVVLAWGRMNPPTAGHELICKSMSTEDGDKKLYLSHTNDHKDNPLPYDRKYYWCEKAFSSYVEVVKSDLRQFLKVLVELYEQGYDEVVIVTGSDRSSELNLALEYNGKEDKPHGYYNFKEISPLVVGKDRNINEDDLPIESVSASRQREFAKEGEQEEFIKYCPSTLSEDECEELYNDVRKGMGLFETLEELHLSEAFDPITMIHLSLIDNLSPGIKNTCKVEPKLNRKRHPLEVLRISPDLEGKISTEDIGKDLKQAANRLKGMLIGDKKITKATVNTNDLSVHPGGSNKFPSFPIEVSYDDGSNETYFISINAGKISKEFVPNKIIDKNIVTGKINYLEVYKHINYDKNDLIKDILVTLTREASLKDNVKPSGNLRGNLDYLKGTPGARNNGSVEVLVSVPETMEKLNNFKRKSKEVYDKVINSIDVDFAEVVGSVALSAAINKVNKTNLTVFYPSASNEPIVDYSIFEGTGEDPLEIKVSAKTGGGGRPSGGGLMDSVMKTKNKKFAPAREFCDWLNKNHFEKTSDKFNAGTKAYHHLAEECSKLLSGSITSNWEKYLTEALNKIPNKGNIVKAYESKPIQKNILILSEECNKAIAALDGSKIDNKRFKIDHNSTYWNNSKACCMSKLFASILNYNSGNDTSPKYLINLINGAFTNSFGVFIQNYCIPNLKSGLEKGVIKFDAVFVSMDGKKLPDGSMAPRYEFLQNTSQEGEDGEMLTQKLAISLKH